MSEDSWFAPVPKGTGGHRADTGALVMPTVDDVWADQGQLLTNLMDRAPRTDAPPALRFAGVLAVLDLWAPMVPGIDKVKVEVPAHLLSW